MKINASDLILIERLIGINNVDVSVSADDGNLVITISYNDIHYQEVILYETVRNVGKESILNSIAYEAKNYLFEAGAGRNKAPWPEWQGNFSG